MRPRQRMAADRTDVDRMKEALTPENEEDRLRALRTLEILDTEAEERFDRLTRLAQGLFKVPISLVSLVESDRQWFKSRQGLDACETPREVSFCAHAVYSRKPLVVPNALEDERFADNPLVTGPPHIRFYAGAPVAVPSGEVVGTLCVIDREPRELSEQQMTQLRDLADAVEAELARREMHELVQALADREAQLQAIQARWQRAIAGTTDALWEWDLSKNEVWYAPRVPKVLGYDHDVERLPTDFPFWLRRVHPEDRKAFRFNLKRQLDEADLVFDVELRLRTADGEYRWFHIRARASRNPQGSTQLVSGSLTDIQRRIEVMAELRAAKQRAEESNVLKSEFLNLVSHELRTPLTVVLGYLPMLSDERGIPPPNVVAEIARDMTEAGNNLLHLINDLLDLSKIDSGQMSMRFETVDAVELVRQVVHQLGIKAAEKNLELACQLPQRLEIHADSLRFQQIFINLVGNAIKFTEQGTVTVEAEDSGEQVVLRVIDTGIGIPEEDLASVFDNFHQVDSSSTRKIHGSGLGLAIVRRLVELHGGTVDVESELGSGSCFRLLLPRVQPHEERRIQNRQPRSMPEPTR